MLRGNIPHSEPTGLSGRPWLEVIRRERQRRSKHPPHHTRSDRAAHHHTLPSTDAISYQDCDVPAVPACASLRLLPPRTCTSSLVSQTQMIHLVAATSAIAYHSLLCGTHRHNGQIEEPWDSKALRGDGDGYSTISVSAGLSQIPMWSPWPDCRHRARRRYYNTKQLQPRFPSLPT